MCHHTIELLIQATKKKCFLNNNAEQNVLIRQIAFVGAQPITPVFLSELFY